MPIRATVDTNLLVSGVIHQGGTPGRVLDASAQHAFALVTSFEQRAELEAVLRRPKIVEKYGVTIAKREWILSALDSADIIVKPVSVPDGLVRDPKDRHIVGAAIAGAVDFLVSGDLDLLVLAGHPILVATEVVTAAEFLTRLAPNATAR